ncbi:hypothetical protein MAJ_09361, partial [Metarhizium majus ARSEF 297]
MALRVLLSALALSPAAVLGAPATGENAVTSLDASTGDGLVARAGGSTFTPLLDRLDQILHPEDDEDENKPDEEDEEDEEEEKKKRRRMIGVAPRADAGKNDDGATQADVAITFLPRRSEGKCKFMIDRDNVPADTPPGIICLNVQKERKIRHRDIYTVVSRILREYDLKCTDTSIKEAYLQDGKRFKLDQKQVSAGEGETIELTWRDVLTVKTECGAMLQCVQSPLRVMDVGANPFKCTLEYNSSGDIPLIEEGGAGLN